MFCCCCVFPRECQVLLVGDAGGLHLGPRVPPQREIGPQTTRGERRRAPPGCRSSDRPPRLFSQPTSGVPTAGGFTGDADRRCGEDCRAGLPGSPRGSAQKGRLWRGGRGRSGTGRHDHGGANGARGPESWAGSRAGSEFLCLLVWEEERFTGSRRKAGKRYCSLAHRGPF